MPKLIEVPHVKQSKQNWCWAACSEMLTAACGARFTQDQLATKHNEKFQFGNDHMASAAENNWVLKNLAGRKTSYRVHAHPYNEAKFTWEEATAMLDACRLFIVGLSNHAWLICGYGNAMDGTKFLWAHDPDSEAGPVKISWDKANFDWRDTVFLEADDAWVAKGGC